MKKILLFTFLILTSTLALAGEFEENLKSFVGKDYQSIVDYWGHPSDSYEGPNGNDVISYYLFTELPDEIGPDWENIKDYCQVFFELGKDLKIISYSYHGTDCRE